MAKTIIRKAVVPYTPEQLFDLVNDVERYPEFIPHCSAASVLSKSESELEAELVLGKGGVTQKFSTRNILERPHKMTLTLRDGPFKQFNGVWQFVPVGEGCEVSFSLTFQFSSVLLNLTVGKIMENIASEQVAVISARAKEIYGA